MFNKITIKLVRYFLKKYIDILEFRTAFSNDKEEYIGNKKKLANAKTTLSEIK